MSVYSMALKVCDTKGHRISARIVQVNDKLNRFQLIKTPEAVLADNPPFLRKGKIDFTYLRVNHTEAIAKVTQYLEDIFMLELANDSNDSSNQTGHKSGGSETASKSRTATISKGKSTDTLHNSGGRKEPTKSDRGRVKDTNLDKGSDKVSGSETVTKDEAISES